MSSVEDIKPIPLIPRENHMNDGDQQRLLQYLDPEFLNALPDDKAIDLELLAMEFKEKLNLSLDAEDNFIEKEEVQTQESAIITSVREYQYELFQKAVNENIIAVLGTGAGKTLISVMLIKHMSLIERQQRLIRRNTKLSFFLVSLVPLVFQQAKVIKANCDAELIEICGSMNVDQWTEKQWEPIFEENDVCVMTAQVFLDVLRRGFLSLEQVNLIIFDECHHAVKKHPFNIIMREFYDRCPFNSRPKIFGMTASPVINKSNVTTSIMQLEKNLNCRVYTATNIDELKLVIPKPQEYIFSYDPPPFYRDSNITAKVREKLGTVKCLSPFFNRINDILYRLGPWCCEKRCISLVSDLNRRMGLAELEEAFLNEEESKIKEAFDICKENGLERNPDTSDISKFSPKVDRLISSLKFESQLSNFCGIIFVERRETAIVLYDLIQSIDQLNHLKPAIITGHGTNDDGDAHFTYRQQNKVIERFRASEVKLLIATNIVEEGLDIQPCNYVYRFDQVEALISYIQSRGRARQKGSKYILFEQSSDFLYRTSNLEQLKQKEEEMKNLCRLMPSERNVANKFSNDNSINFYDIDDDDDDDYLEDALLIPETEALITKQNSIPLLYKYCESLPADSYSSSSPVFICEGEDTAFECYLRLPSNAPFLELHSPICKSKNRAKALVALEACKKLRYLKQLDEHLRPFNFRKEILGELAPETDNNGMVIGSRRRHHLYEKRNPQLWERNDVVDDEIIKTEDDLDLLKARKNMNVEYLKVNDPIEELLGTQYPNIMNNHNQQYDLEDDLIMFDNNENPLDNSTESTLLDDGPCSYWASIFQIVTEDNKINGLPYRQLCIMSRKPIPSLPQIKLSNRNQPVYVNVYTINIEFKYDKERIIYLSKYMFNIMSTLLNKDFTCPFEDVSYFILPIVKEIKHQTFDNLTAEKLEKLIDWDEVNNIAQLKSDPFIIETESSTKDIILVDTSNCYRKYLVESINYSLNPKSVAPTDVSVRESGYESFQEYYIQNKKTPPSNLEQPMIHGRQLRRKLDYLSKDLYIEPKIKGGAHAWLVPEFCKTHYMSLSVFQAMLIVPSIMVRVDSLLLLKEAKKKYDLHIEDNLLLEAYTTPASNMEMNYERLEILGDSILKLLSTISLYVNFPFKDEGQLHHLRIRIVCNKALYRAAKRLKFYRYITSHAFNKRYWRPPHFTSVADNNETMEYLKYHGLSDKTLADIVEASLGASFISGGLESSLKTAIQLQIPLDNITCWSDIYPIYKNSRKEAPPRVQAGSQNIIDLPKIKEITGYDFKNPLLVVEALTHASLPNSQVPCYQRLEFLGDAILDFMAVRYLYSKYTEAGPGKISELKGSCVNNNLLGIICLQTGLHKHIIHFSGKMIQAIHEFENQIQGIRNCDKVNNEYWQGINVPKVLPDVVESMLGAVFVDADFDLKPVEILFEKWFLETFENHVSPELIVCHPVTKLIHILQNFGCEGFKLRNQTSNGTDKDSQKAVIFLHDRALANGSDSNIKMARRKAATRALQRLEDEPSILENVCNCRVSLVKRGIYSKEPVDLMDEDDSDSDVDDQIFNSQIMEP